MNNLAWITLKNLSMFSSECCYVTFGNAHGKDLVLDFKSRQELRKELWPECLRALNTTLCSSVT